ncbi:MULTISPECIES: fatty acid desaturase family protein [Thermomonosporaceae]|uniref:fatty acid desaturase family protein n=1 Tax=Thermomonosporaceae TaxID=2012 RepID=UPI00255B190E|nr:MULTISPECIES: acyl-CoA desaturase [Thermomonosporaceae]MDL4776612.1 acyl-CoA desaturase [Actinomadura xylanilytica]
MPATLDAPPVRAAGSDFAPLARQVRASGLLDRRIGYYVRAIGLNLGATAAAWAAVAWAGGSWWVVLLAVPLALLSGRTAFLGHDAGHRQIAGSAKANRLLGLLVGNLMLGMGHGWWTDKHNRHHANPNHVGKDPDVGEGVLVWTQEQAEKARGRGVFAWIGRHQARLFFPLLLLEGLNLQVNSVLYLRGRSVRDKLVEGGLFALHAAGYLALVFTLLSPGKAVVLILLHQGLFGVHLGSVFAPNHKGMVMPEPGAKLGHLQRQVLTSRNVRGGLAVDWFTGGLNYQIEHHLFPSIPRPNLRKVRPLVREHCAAVGLPYAETGLIDSYRQALAHMHEVGEPLRG